MRTNISSYKTLVLSSHDEATKLCTHFSDPIFFPQKHLFIIRKNRMSNLPQVVVPPSVGAIVVFKDSVVNSLVKANDLASRFNFTVRNTFQFSIKGFSASLPRATIDLLRNHPDVDYIEDDLETSAASQTISWGFKRLGASESPTLDFSNPRNLLGVHLFLLDTGIELTNAEFNFVVTENKTFVPNQNVNDINGHGSSIAGIIASKNNTESVCGLCPGASIHNYKVLGNNGKGCISYALAALESMIRWTLQNPLEYKVVVNMSFTAFTGSEKYTVLDKAIKTVVDTYRVPVVVAAGNDRADASYYTPAHCHEAFTVGVYNIKNELCEFSNFGSVIDFLAPGELVLTTFLGGKCALISGTSVACAHVAGAVCLERQKNPTKTPIQLKNTLLTYASQNNIVNPLIRVPYQETTTLSVYVREI